MPSYDQHESMEVVILIYIYSLSDIHEYFLKITLTCLYYVSLQPGTYNTHKFLLQRNATWKTSKHTTLFIEALSRKATYHIYDI